MEDQGYQWDRRKSKSNHQQHGIYFADTVPIFEDEFAITVEDDYEEEQRFIRLGMDVFWRILVVVYTWRGDDIRIISARKAKPSERRQYEEKR